MAPHKYGQAQDGDWSSAFSERHGISLAQLYAWNSKLGANGENSGGSLWGAYRRRVVKLLALSKSHKPMSLPLDSKLGSENGSARLTSAGRG